MEKQSSSSLNEQKMAKPLCSRARRQLLFEDKSNLDVSEMKSALKRSKEMFLEKVFPTEEEKQAIACRGMKLKTINKWFINYRTALGKLKSACGDNWLKHLLKLGKLKITFLKLNIHKEEISLQTIPQSTLEFVSKQHNVVVDGFYKEDDIVPVCKQEDMVLPTCLKRRHSLKGVRLVAAIKRIRGGQPQGLKEFARFQKDNKLDNLSMDDLRQQVLDLTGAELQDLLQFANRDNTVEEARWATHCLILYANEYGQPSGQDLTQSQDQTPTTSANPLNVQMSGDIVQSSGDNNNNGTNKRKRDDLEDRIANLENTTKEEVVKNLKEKVRTLCLQDNPSDSLILLTLEELAKAARRVNHDDADTFEELTRQANRHQLKLDISSLCLSVLGGKVADAITKAVSKCLKEKQPEKDTTPKPEDSPLHNLYPPYQAPCMYPYNAMPYLQPPYPGGFNNNYRGRPRNSGNFGNSGIRQRGACLFCESTSHQIRDCDKMKAAKGK
ncbi:unnamed protein product [Mytilus edulis]|uniref:Homeobox domain-containing protein n=1 Tax=Mytilus edulis TaxID=6550 RepID=A0A8S3R8G0_MYTED|nr:unnamed protein product [Mytilus edulis]